MPAIQAKTLCSYIVAAFLTTGLMACASGHQTGSTHKQTAIERLLRSNDVPGIGYAQLSNCEIVETGTGGFADIDQAHRVDNLTLFEAASLSKPVFAWLVMSLVEDGLINLDQSLADAGFDSERVFDKVRFAELTPRLILSHRSGLPNWAGDARNPDRQTPLPFLRNPSTDHSYSGEAYTLLQRFIEQATGQTLSALFAERLAERMPNSTFRLP